MAAEKRLLALQQTSGPSNATALKEDTSDSDDDRPAETDQDRRRTLLDSMSESEAGTLKTFTTDFADDFILPSAGPSGSRTSAGGGTIPAVNGHGASSSTASSSNKGKNRGVPMTPPTSGQQDQKTIAEYLDPSRPSKKRKLSYGNLVEEEINYRQKEALGMSGGGQKLGATSARSSVARSNSGQPGSPRVSNFPSESATPQFIGKQSASWSCQVCTL